MEMDATTVILAATVVVMAFFAVVKLVCNLADWMTLTPSQRGLRNVQMAAEMRQQVTQMNDSLRRDADRLQAEVRQMQAEIFAEMGTPMFFTIRPEVPPPTRAEVEAKPKRKTQTSEELSVLKEENLKLKARIAELESPAQPWEEQ